ncbi:MAG: hypothetical protein WAZ75_02695 [Candidatus Absconditicoccaceae bacterium]
MSAKLWFLQNIEDIMEQNNEKFGIGKNSWYNKLFMSVHLFIAGKYFQREGILQEMELIYKSDTPPEIHESKPIGFILPSKKKKEGKLEFGLTNPENVEKLRPIRSRNDKLNEELFILQDFLMFLYSIDPRSQIFEEQYLSQLESMFEQWWEEQMTLRTKALEDLKTQDSQANSDQNGKPISSNT